MKQLTFLELLNMLQDPAAYSHTVESIRVIQSHTSCVFLTGEYAYKIKKPVDFGFLNYSTLDRRHECCEQELRLNQRLCPDIYLDVLPITDDSSGLKVGGSGRPVEWAVRMRQLRAEDMLPQRLHNATVGTDQIASLAHKLAIFHGSAPSSDAIRTCGAPTVIADTIAITLQTMDTVSSHMQSAEIRHALRSYLETFLFAKEDLFFSRIEQNRIRECHGDLRTQNICLDAHYNGGMQIFDCIEFQNAFRHIDVAADIAYLAMDLDLAGRSDLREHLLDVYMCQTSDTSLAQILPFYLVYRAIVRGNIALLAAAESEIPEMERQQQRDIAAAAYDLARCYALRRPGPTLLITVGYSGSGKSTLATELVRRLPAVRLSSDAMRREVTGIPVGVTLDSAEYSAERRAEIYEMLRQRADTFLQRGLNVLLDATFLDLMERAAVAQIALAYNAEFWILECRCPEEILRQRMRARHSDPNASDADLRVYELQRSAYPSPVTPLLPTCTRCHHVLIDTSLPVTENAHHLVDRFTDISQSAITGMM